MAAINLSKFSVYDRLAQVNRGFDHITDNLIELRDSAIFSGKQLEAFQGLAKELQAEINHELTRALRDIEAKDAFRYGRVRVAREKTRKE
ncbi:MAG TPA: hypothetical protein VKZ53_02580 [Candidatus Angelobacter sp.]|nr:hypothetical protein [Candidatus Angelobacter sp.]